MLESAPKLAERGKPLESSKAETGCVHLGMVKAEPFGSKKKQRIKIGKGGTTRIGKKLHALLEDLPPPQNKVGVTEWGFL